MVQKNLTPSYRYSPDERVRIESDVVWRDVEGDFVLFDKHTGTYHALNRVGSFVWRRIGAGMTVSAIMRDAAAHFDADEATIAQGIAAFLKEAIQLSLLTRCGTIEAE